MKSKLGWIIAIILGLILAFILPSLWIGRTWFGGYRMMGGYSHMGSLGFFGMGLMWLIPAAMIILLVVGVVGLLTGWQNKNRTNANPDVPGRTCSSCGKAAQADWHTCPYCGQPLA